MAAGPIIILDLDSEPAALRSWQVAKSPTAAQVALTAAQLTTTMRDISAADSTLALEVFDVSGFLSIAVQAWGVAAATNTFTLELYGWSEDGSLGHRLGIIQPGTFGAHVSLANVGFHQSPYTHKSIRKKFLAGTDYLGAKSYVLFAQTAVKYLNVTEFVQIQVADGTDFPTGFQVNFFTSNVKYFGMAVTAMTGTSVGAIFRPLEFRDRL